jgi:hypothetical protein
MTKHFRTNTASLWAAGSPWPPKPLARRRPRANWWLPRAPATPCKRVDARAGTVHGAFSPHWLCAQGGTDRMSSADAKSPTHAGLEAGCFGRPWRCRSCTNCCSCVPRCLSVEQNCVVPGHGRRRRSGPAFAGYPVHGQGAPLWPMRACSPPASNLPRPALAASSRAAAPWHRPGPCADPTRPLRRCTRCGECSPFVLAPRPA